MRCKLDINDDNEDMHVVGNMHEENIQQPADLSA